MFKYHHDAIRSLAVHPSGSLFAAASEDGSWSLGEVETGALLCQVSHPSEKYRICALHPDGNLLAAASDRSLQVWDLRANRAPLAPLDRWALPTEYASLAFADSGYHLASAQTDGRLSLWDLRTSRLLHSAQHPSAVAAAAFDPSARLLAAASGQNIALYTLSGRKCRDLVTLSGTADLIVGMDWTLDAGDRSASPLLISAAADATLRVWSF